MNKARAKYHHGDLRQAILDLAKSKLETGGVDTFSLRSLAAEIGVTHGALYNHFINKDAVLSALAAIGYHELAKQLATAETAEQHLRLYATFALKHRHAYINMMTRSHRQFETVPELRAGADAVIEVSLSLLAPRQGSETQKRRAVMRHWMLVHGGVSLHIAGTLQNRPDDAFVAELLAIAGLPSEPDEITPHS